MICSENHRTAKKSERFKPPRGVMADRGNHENLQMSNFEEKSSARTTGQESKKTADQNTSSHQGKKGNSEVRGGSVSWETPTRGADAEGNFARARS